MFSINLTISGCVNYNMLPTFEILFISRNGVLCGVESVGYYFIKVNITCVRCQCGSLQIWWGA